MFLGVVNSPLHKALPISERKCIIHVHIVHPSFRGKFNIQHMHDSSIIIVSPTLHISVITFTENSKVRKDKTRNFSTLINSYEEIPCLLNFCDEFVPVA